MADRLLILDGGKVLTWGAPQAVAFATLREQAHPMLASMPAPMRIWSSVPSNLPCPLTAGSGRQFLEQWAAEHPLRPLPQALEPQGRAGTLGDSPGGLVPI